MAFRISLRALATAGAAACLVLIPAASAQGGNANAGDVWVDNVGQPAGPGQKMDPHLACQDINLWGNGLAGSSGSYTIDGWPPSGSQDQDYSAGWSYGPSAGGTQILDVISVKSLIASANANGDVPQSNQGFHFKLEFSADPQKHKTFWVDCRVPSIVTTAASGTVGQPIHDVATLTATNAGTGTISWNVYAATATSCSKPLNATPLRETISGDGTYASPDFTASAPGGYQWVATYSGDAQNLSVSTRCNDPQELSQLSKATPAIATTATSNTAGQPIHDVAFLTGGDAPTGTITWNVYAANTGCTASLHTVSVMVAGAGTYTSPDYVPLATGTYQWVATYSGDTNNVSLATACNDPQEQSNVQPVPAPGISLVKLERIGSGSFTHGPITGNASDAVTYQVTVINTGNTTLLINFADPHCDAGTLSPPVLKSGTFDGITSTLSAGGELQYTCSHVLSAGDAPSFTNTASVSGQPPSGPPVSGSDTVVAYLNLPGMTVLKLQRDGSSGSFTTGTITALVGDRIQYEIQVQNTGTALLTLTLSDPRCDAGTTSGPVPISGTLSGNVLSPGGEAQYTCSHVLRPGDPSPFTNTATVTGQPPSGPPVVASSHVTVTKQAVNSVKIVRCSAGKVKQTKKVHGKKVIVCVARKRPVISRKPIRPMGFTG